MIVRAVLDAHRIAEVAIVRVEVPLDGSDTRLTDDAVDLRLRLEPCDFRTLKLKLRDEVAHNLWGGSLE